LCRFKSKIKIAHFYMNWCVENFTLSSSRSHFFSIRCTVVNLIGLVHFSISKYLILTFTKYLLSISKINEHFILNDKIVLIILYFFQTTIIILFFSQLCLKGLKTNSENFLFEFSKSFFVLLIFFYKRKKLKEIKFTPAQYKYFITFNYRIKYINAITLINC
jgi:hypothetical protein